MKRIPLTQGKVAIVDDRFYERLTAMGHWTYSTTWGYAQLCDGKTTMQMHRIIWKLAGRRLPRLLDHRDLNKLNNRLNNLRPATPSQSAQNRGISSRNSSGFKGVHCDRASGKWIARIMVRGVRKFLGRHETAEKAAKAYDEAALYYHGPFAHTNFANAA